VHLFHGSPKRGLTSIKPAPGKRVWATPDVVLAVTFARFWNDKDFSLGRIGRGPWTMVEQYRGAFRLLRGTGYLYLVLRPDNFRPRPRGKGLGPYEWTSRKGSPVMPLMVIPNVYEALVAMGVRLKRKD
jgi:hypothetical protein